MKPAFLIAAAAVALTGLSACTSPTSPAGAMASANNSCINPTRIQKQTIVSDEEIRFEMNDGKVWVNKLPRACNGLKFEGGFSWKVHGTQVCSNQEIIEVLNRGTTCMLGEFTQVPAVS